MPVSAECPHCRTRCRVPDAVGDRKIRCPRCQKVFQPSAPPVVELVAEAEAVVTAPPRRRSRELIPPPPEGAPIRKTPNFLWRELKGAIIILAIVLGMSVISLAAFALLRKWWWIVDQPMVPPAPPIVQQQESAPPQPAKAVKPATKDGEDLKAAPQARDHGPPPAYEEWTVLDEQRLEHKEGIWHAAISADSQTLATTSNSFLRLWDLSATPPTEKASMRMPVRRSTALRFAPDGKTLWLGLPDHTLRLLDVTGPQITERLRLKDWAKSVWVVTYSPDGKTLAVGADDMTVWLYDALADKPREKSVLRVEKTTFGVKELFFTADSKRLILGTGAGAVRLWDVSAKEPKELATNQGPSDTFLLPMALSPDGKILAVGRGKTVHLLDVVEDGFAEWMKLSKHSGGLRAVNFSPDGQLLATTGTDGQIIVWKVGLDKPILVKQRAGTFCEVLFVPGSKDVRLIACNWNSGAIYLLKMGK